MACSAAAPAGHVLARALSGIGALFEFRRPPLHCTPLLHAGARTATPSFFGPAAPCITLHCTHACLVLKDAICILGARARSRTERCNLSWCEKRWNKWWRGLSSCLLCLWSVLPRVPPLHPQWCCTGGMAPHCAECRRRHSLSHAVLCPLPLLQAAGGLAGLHERPQGEGGGSAGKRLRVAAVRRRDHSLLAPPFLLSLPACWPALLLVSGCAGWFRGTRGLPAALGREWAWQQGAAPGLGQALGARGTEGWSMVCSTLLSQPGGGQPLCVPAACFVLCASRRCARPAAREILRLPSQPSGCPLGFGLSEHAPAIPNSLLLLRRWTTLPGPMMAPASWRCWG